MTLSRAIGMAWRLPLAVVLVSSSVSAQSPQVERIEIFDAGIYCADTVEKVRDPNAPTGYRNVVTNMKLMRRTSQVPALLGTRFGMRYTVIGAQAGTIVDIRLVTRVPLPGLRDPESGKVTVVNDYSMIASIGEPGYREYHLEYNWEALPGLWIFELWDKDRKLAEQRFTLFRPQKDEKSLIGCAPVVGHLDPRN
jgi:hypothetical protein